MSGGRARSESSSSSRKGAAPPACGGWEAVTGHGALRQYSDAYSAVQRMSALLKAREGSVVESLERLIAERKRLDREIADLKVRLARANLDDLLARAREIGGMRVIAAKVAGVERDQLRPLADTLRQRIGSGLVVLATEQAGRVALVAAATKDVAGKKVHAGKVIREVAKLVGGGGGGRPDMAEAGGRNPAALPEALERAYGLVAAQAGR